MLDICMVLRFTPSDYSWVKRLTVSFPRLSAAHAGRFDPRMVRIPIARLLILEMQETLRLSNGHNI
jgi:hypothetical protein